MLKTVNDIMETVGLSEGSRTALLSRINNKWKIKAEKDHYRKLFSNENFNKIVKFEKRFKSQKKNNDNFSRKKKSMYQQNKGSHLYSRLTHYGGLT